MWGAPRPPLCLDPRLFIVFVALQVHHMFRVHKFLWWEASRWVETSFFFNSISALQHLLVLQSQEFEHPSVRLLYSLPLARRRREGSSGTSPSCHRANIHSSEISQKVTWLFFLKDVIFVPLLVSTVVSISLILKSAMCLFFFVSFDVNIFFCCSHSSVKL